MARIKVNPLRTIVSMRINDQERQQIQLLMKQTHKTVSDLMREAIIYFAANHTDAQAGSRKLH